MDKSLIVVLDGLSLQHQHATNISVIVGGAAQLLNTLQSELLIRKYPTTEAIGALAWEVGSADIRTNFHNFCYYNC